jgi:hypothetical protein
LNFTSNKIPNYIMQRSKFIKNAAASSAAFSIVQSFVRGKKHVPPSDTLYVAAFGVGGRGAGVITGLDEPGTVNYVSLCDVDARRAAETFLHHEKVPRYTDFRKVYDKHLEPY